MGDTLPHLETFDQVQLLFEIVYLALETSGKAALILLQGKMEK